MTKFKLKFLVIFVMILSVAFFLVPAQTRAADQFCFCSDDLNQINFANYSELGKNVEESGCAPQIAGKSCEEQIKRTDSKPFVNCNAPASEQACNDARQAWIKNRDEKIRSAGVTSQAMGSGLIGNIPPCLLKDEFTEECRDVGVFIKLLINWGGGSFAILGVFALAFFVYGGFILILSQGNPEKVKKGTDAMLAAVVGLFICFVAYLAIQFLGQAVGLKPEFGLL